MSWLFNIGYQTFFVLIGVGMVLSVLSIIVVPFIGILSGLFREANNTPEKKNEFLNGLFFGIGLILLIPALSLRYIDGYTAMGVTILLFLWLFGLFTNPRKFFIEIRNGLTRSVPHILQVIKITTITVLAIVFTILGLFIVAKMNLI